MVLAVKRPSDDELLPDVWGLPAASLKNDETPEEAVLRCGREKLGTEIKIVKLLGEGEIEWGKHILNMRVYTAEITHGKPKCSQSVKGVTQYQDWKWTNTDDLKEAARKGSLCCRVFLSSLQQEW